MAIKMKISKNIIILMSILCICFFGLAVFFEFGYFETLSCNVLRGHMDFYTNISLSVFASGILVLIPSIVQYLTEKKRYYVEIYRIINYMLSEAIEIILRMEEYSQDGSIFSHFEKFRLIYNELITEYSTFTCFFKLSQKDKLVESVISETVRFILIQEELLKYSKQIKEGTLSKDEYKKCFDVVRNELINSFKKEFVKYQMMIEKDIMRLIKDKKIEKYY
ncbi:hypothetical protein [Proteiniborus sp. MB09-C3]|uniref:hypothetical protein n=1 Tax=Proteiniborus sp. MB09-C3 TaxID=3050072 RepID=UPI002553B88A|nr:hypothetical protein [Proteiniborus sp. MB09-C3]WIV11093.1 hypothetical protein QO263_13155 [Proteiniborus sp. MB09-C3]